MGIGASLSALMIAGGASAQERDFQTWAGASAIAPVGVGGEVRVDTLFTLADEATEPGRELVRVVALAKLPSQFKLGGGSVWTHFKSTGLRGYDERRVVEEVDWRGHLAPALDIAMRSQFEQRWRDRTRGVSLRWRQLTRLEWSPRKDLPALIAWNEYFHELRPAEWAGGAGPSLMLNFVGVRLPLTHSLTVEPGYLNQTQFLKGRRNSVVHAAALFFTLRF